MKKNVAGFLLAFALIIVSYVVQGTSVDVYASSKVTLQPGVADFIQNTYLSHQAEFPNPNENVDVLKSYLGLKGSPEGIYMKTYVIFPPDEMVLRHTVIIRREQF